MKTEISSGTATDAANPKSSIPKCINNKNQFPARSSVIRVPHYNRKSLTDEMKTREIKKTSKCYQAALPMKEGTDQKDQ